MNTVFEVKDVGHSGPHTASLCLDGMPRTGGSIDNSAESRLVVACGSGGWGKGEVPANGMEFLFWGDEFSKIDFGDGLV